MQIVRPTLWGARRVTWEHGHGDSSGSRFRRLRVVGWLLLGGCALLVFLAGIVNLKWYARERIYPAWQNAITWMKSVPARPRELRMHIAFKDYQRLAFDREQALEFGKLVQHEESFVPALIEMPDRKVKAKVRLKGGALDHLKGDKWSMRIKITDDDAVFGMTFFSIQNPVRSSFAYEWVLHEMMRREGLIAPRYDFINVTINGRPMGIYALEESFSKELVEAHGRREGPIVRLDESFLFVKDGPVRQTDVFFASQVDGFQSRKIQRSSVLASQFAIARNLLQGFRDQKLSVAEVFDVEKLATYFALIDLCNASHACRWKNIRFYYNPVTSLLEPIPYNAYSARSAAGARVGPSAWLCGQFTYSPFHVSEWMDDFFKDPAFYEAYVKALSRVSAEPYLEDVFADIGDDLEMKLRIICKDDPEYRFCKDYLVQGANLIRNAIRPVLKLNAYWATPSSLNAAPHLRVANTNRLKVQVTGIFDSRTQELYRFSGHLTLSPRVTDVPLPVDVPLPESARTAITDFTDNRFELRYRVVGMDEIHTTPIQLGEFGEPASWNLAQRADRDPNRFRRMEMFDVDGTARTLRIKAGTWHVQESVYLPAGFTVQAGSGVHLQMEDGASLISRSPISFTGSQEQPIVIAAPGGQGAGGLVVMGASDTSHVQHVQFENLGTPTEGHWQVTGAVTFYESPVEIRDCVFRGGQSEDQLNIVRSDFLIVDSRFDAAFGDALDVDFGHGAVRRCRFTAMKNDAIDLSGSTARIAHCTMDGAGDKAISAGECSRVVIEDSSVSGSRFGLVSKDLSTLTAKHVTVESTGTALAAFQKKPEYGPASITLQDTQPDVTVLNALTEKGSWIERNGIREDGRMLNVARQIYVP